MKYIIGSPEPTTELYLKQTDEGVILCGSDVTGREDRILTISGGGLIVVETDLPFGLALVYYGR